MSADVSAEEFFFNPYIPLFAENDRYFWQVEMARRIELPAAAHDLVEVTRAGGAVRMEQLRANIPLDTVIAMFTDGVVVDHPADTDLRGSRMDGFWSVQGRNGISPALKKAHVLVLGAGGIGSHVAWALAAMGVAEMTVLDCDVVEASNLNRQLLYTEKDIGQFKVDALADHLRDLDHDLVLHAVNEQVVSSEMTERLLAGGSYTLVVKAIDTPPAATSWVNRACVAHRIPFVQAGFMRATGVVGPTYVPGRTPCTSCFEGDPLDVLERVSGTGPSSPQLTEVVAGKLVGEIVRVLAGEVPCYGSAIELYLERSNQSRMQALTAQPSCQVCGRSETRQARDRRAPRVGAAYFVVAAALPLVATLPYWRIPYTLAVAAGLQVLQAGDWRNGLMFRRALCGGAVYSAVSLGLTLRLNPTVLHLGPGRVDAVSVVQAALYAIAMFAVAITIFIWLATAVYMALDLVRSVLRPRLARFGLRLARQARIPSVRVIEPAVVQASVPRGGGR
jgi:molybdopterin/thiamine biosynthesis adenylyltransferase